MSDQLAGKVIQQIGVFVVTDVIKIDESPDEIVLEPLLRLHPSTEAQGLLLMSSKMLNQEVPVRRLVMDVRAIQGKRMKAGGDLTRRHDKDSWNVDGLLHNELSRLCDHGRNARRGGHAGAEGHSLEAVTRSSEGDRAGR